MFYSGAEMLAGKTEDKRKVGRLGHTAAAGGQVTCPELGVKTTACDRCVLVQEMLHRATGRPCHHLAHPTPSCKGGFWIHSSALVPIFKRQTQFFFCSILIAKMFNFQTFVFPEKCFKNRNIPSVLIIFKWLFPLRL